MSDFIFVADNTIPGLGAAELRRLATPALSQAAASAKDLRRFAFWRLRDLGLDRDAC